VLGNSTGKSDATAKYTEKNAGVAEEAGRRHRSRKIAPSRYAHNKFAILCDGTQKPKVAGPQHQLDPHRTVHPEQQRLEITDDKIAAAYHEHWS